MYGGQNGENSRDEDAGFMQRSNTTQLGMRGQYYEPLPFEE